MKISESGIELIKRFEGFRSTPYRCSAGVLTIGYGTTNGVRPGDVVSEAQAHRLLVEHCDNICATMRPWFPHEQVSQGCTDAFVSLAYNVGVEAVRRSRCLAALNSYLETKERNYLDSCLYEFRDFNRANGQTLPGLVRRREAEIEHWLTNQN